MAIVTALALALLLFGLIYFARFVWLGLRSQWWPVTSGVVTASAVSLEMPLSDDVAFNPTVQYRYNVGCRVFTGSRIRALNWIKASQEAAAAPLRRYPVGATVVVRYDPRRPEDALLEPGVSVLDVIAFLSYVGVCLLVIWELAEQTGLDRLPWV